jgi:hypothetical protein
LIAQTSAVIEWLDAVVGGSPQRLSRRGCYRVNPSFGIVGKVSAKGVFVCQQPWSG